jgi:S1-C subfamily serine protease
LLNLRGEVIGVNTYRFGLRGTISQIKVPRLKEVDKSVKLDGFDVYKALTEVDPTVGINYARSCRSAVPIIRKIISTGQIVRPDLGFEFDSFTWEEAVAFGWKTGGHPLKEGVVVQSVVEGSPAAKARVWVDHPYEPKGAPKPAQGLAKGDIVNVINWEHPDGKKGTETVVVKGDLLNALAQVPLGSKVKLSIQRPLLVPLEGFGKNYYRLLSVEYTLPEK